MKTDRARICVAVVAFAVAVMSACSEPGRSAASEAKADQYSHDAEPIVYQAPHGYRSILFDPAATRLEIHFGGTDDAWHGGEFSYRLSDCSDTFLVCRSDPAGTLIAIPRHMEEVDSWNLPNMHFTVTRRARGRLPNSRVVFVNITSPHDATWRRSFVYESGVGVTSITLNYDDRSKFSETFVLVGRRGILAEL
jgi:hypothetical protein